MVSAADVIAVTYGGKTFRASRHTDAHLAATFAAFKKKYPKATLRIAQGCYHTGVAASAGTHDKDGVIDFVVEGLDWWAFQRFLREHGWGAWYRHTGEWAAESQWHCHSISLGGPGPWGKFIDGGKSTVGHVVASSQIADYYNHALGLAGEHNSGEDTSWFPPNIDATLFHWSPPKPKPALSRGAHVDAALVELQAALAANLAKTHPAHHKIIAAAIADLEQITAK